MNVTIYHNPRCSKSRQTLALLQDAGIAVTMIEYLKTPPQASDIKGLLQKLGLSVQDIMRKKEDIYKQLNLAEVDDEAVLIAAICDNPILLERPIVVRGGDARICRPPTCVWEIVPAP